MGRRVLKGEVQELRSLGIDVKEINQKGKKELEELIDDMKQMMIREFRAAYSLKEKNLEIKSTSSF